MSVRLPRGGEIQTDQNRTFNKNCWHFIGFRLEGQILVMTISTISMRQNCSISFSADPGGAPTFSSNLDPPRYNRPSFTVAKWRIPDVWSQSHFYKLSIRLGADILCSEGRVQRKYCRDETDPIAISGVSDSVADYEIGEMAKWRMAALGKTAWYACGALARY